MELAACSSAHYKMQFKPQPELDASACTCGARNLTRGKKKRKNTSCVAPSPRVIKAMKSKLLRRGSKIKKKVLFDIRLELSPVSRAATVFEYKSHATNHSVGLFLVVPLLPLVLFPRPLLSAHP